MLKRCTFMTLKNYNFMSYFKNVYLHNKCYLKQFFDLQLLRNYVFTKFFLLKPVFCHQIRKQKYI